MGVARLEGLILGSSLDNAGFGGRKVFHVLSEEEIGVRAVVDRADPPNNRSPQLRCVLWNVFECILSIIPASGRAGRSPPSNRSVVRNVGSVLYNSTPPIVVAVRRFWNRGLVPLDGSV